MDALMAAIKKDDLQAYNKLVDYDPSLPHNLFDNINYPLHVACEYNRPNFVQTLVEEQMADLNVRCKLTGFTPLMYAC